MASGVTAKKTPFLYDSGEVDVSTDVSINGSYTCPADGFYIILLESKASGSSSIIHLDGVSIAASGYDSSARVILPLKKGTVITARTTGTASNYTFRVVSYFPL